MPTFYVVALYWTIHSALQPLGADDQPGTYAVYIDDGGRFGS